MAKPGVLQEASSLLYWTMLAACTVGPGTVVTCARAGAEYGLQLVWPLVFASVLAYALQEGTARLTIVSGKSLGQCLRQKYSGQPKIRGAAVTCWLVTLAVYCGNVLYECNNWAGGIDAVFAMPGVSGMSVLGQQILQVGSCLTYAALVMFILAWDKVDALGTGLGIVMLAMVALFLWVVVSMGFSWTSLCSGMIPNIPDEVSPHAANPADTILSLVGTTSIGFNLFLGGSMAEGRELKAARRGIAFSTTAALIVSILILLVGSGAFQEGSSTGRRSQFSIELLAEAIHGFVGAGGVVVFSCGFIAAALSSMLTVALGAYLAARSMLLDEPLAPDGARSREMEARTRWARWAIVTSMVLVATGVVSCNLPRKTIILVAQVFNGMLLPVFSFCLLFCINDLQFMAEAPQGLAANSVLLPSVAITLFLAMRVAVQKFLGVLAADDPRRDTWLALLLAVAVMAVVLCMTSLKADLRRSLAEARRRQASASATKQSSSTSGKGNDVVAVGATSHSEVPGTV